MPFPLAQGGRGALSGPSYLDYPPAGAAGTRPHSRWCPFAEGAYPYLVRLVSLLPSATEIVYSLGLGKNLVGVTFECDWPPARICTPCTRRPSRICGLT